jgi:biopolymer transport protein ExbB
VNVFAGFFAFLVRGGPAMLALFVCSLVAIAVVVERLLFYAQQHIDADALVAQLSARVKAGDVDGAIAICDQNHGLLPQILKVALVRAGRSRADVAEALSAALKRRLPAFNRNLPIIGTLAVIAPFVGLFGTVLGIIHAFDDIALKGNSSPAVVAAGVGEALVTTAAGLFVAVVSVIFFNYFKTRSQSCSQEIVGAAEDLAEVIHFHNIDAELAFDANHRGAKVDSVAL